MNGFVRTVLGDVPPGELGPTYYHEHLITRPAPRFGDDLRLDDEDKAAEELAQFRVAGGRALVDATTPEFGRDAAALRRLAERNSVHLVATTGHVSEEYWRGVIDLDGRSEADLIAEYVVELSSGIDGGPTRAGVVKAGTSAGGPTVTEKKLLRAAAEAQRETGAPITTHTTAGTGALAQTEVLVKAGADLTHVCIGHLDCMLDWDIHLELARRGVFLGYDCISKEQYAPDAERVRFIARLVAEGHGHQICLSGDLARRSYLEAWGGSPGYRYILESFLPLLRATGLEDESDKGRLRFRPERRADAVGCRQFAPVSACGLSPQSCSAHPLRPQIGRVSVSRTAYATFTSQAGSPTQTAPYADALVLLLRSCARRSRLFRRHSSSPSLHRRKGPWP